MQRRRLGQPHVAIQAGARIPACRFRRVVEADRELVVAGVQPRRQVDAEAVVAVGPAACKAAVDPDAGIGHGAVDVEEDGLTAVGGRDGKGLAVPGRAPGLQPPHAAVRAARQERAFDRPVVLQAHGAPSAVVEAYARERCVHGRVLRGTRVTARRIPDEGVSAGEDPGFQHRHAGSRDACRFFRHGVGKLAVGRLSDLGQHII